MDENLKNLDDTNTFRTSNYLQPRYNCHFHDFYEIYYFISGDADYLVEGREFHLTPHSLILLSPYVLHSVKINSDADYVRSCIYFRPEDILPERRSFLLSCFPGSTMHERQQEIFLENLQSYDLEIYLNSILRLRELSGSEQEQYYPILLEALLARIRLVSQTRHPSAHTHAATAKITEVINYLNLHLSEQITLDDISGCFYLNKYYLERAFKKATGTTILNYLTYKRITLARQYLLNGDSANEAAARVGFTDYSAFFRAYKKVLGHCPSTDKEIVTIPYD